MSDLKTQFNNVDSNGKYIVELFETNIEPNDLKNIIENENLIATILNNCIIQAAEKGSTIEFEAWEELFLENTKQQLYISKDTHTQLKNLKEDIFFIRALNKKVQRIKIAFDEKIIHELNSSEGDIWTDISTWVNESYEPFINVPKVANEPLKLKCIEWINDTKSELIDSLQKEIKDFLHAKVNKLIILGKIKSDQGWHDKINQNKSKNSSPLKQYEVQINSDIKKITGPINAPFIKSFEKELFSRCYKQLISKTQPKPKQTTISIRTSDITLKEVKEIKLTSTVSSQYKSIYLNLLTAIVTSQINIKKFAKENISILKNLANNADLSEKEKSDIKSSYRNLYLTIRHYETETAFWENEISKNLTNELKITLLSKSLEAAFHRYRPFAQALFDELKIGLKTMELNERKKYISIYDDVNKRLQSINAYLIKVRQVNKYCQTTSKLPSMNNKFNNIDELLKKSNQPWTNHDWAPILDEIIQFFGITINEPNPLNRKIEPAIQNKRETVSTIISETPKKEESHHQLNESA